MNIYTLMQCNNGDIELSHTSCCYPVEFEKKINNIAEEEITIKYHGVSFMPNLYQSFCIKKDKVDIFIKKVIPNIGFKSENNKNFVWDNDELNPEI